MFLSMVSMGSRLSSVNAGCPIACSTTNMLCSVVMTAERSTVSIRYTYAGIDSMKYHGR